ncbi:MAG: NAD kinase [Flavobacteriales bacterium]|nr:NAD kinase [Candidatus Arcticimaribacter sp.]|tara:strand:+ start:4085 stop:4957 length:873 start_codon:yes stop_codon:yes gene_type:complete
MKIAIICPFQNELSRGYAQGVVEHLLERKVTVLVDSKMVDFLKDPDMIAFVSVFEKLPKNTDFLFCIGGDGSMLQAIISVKDSNVPILGINTGRLGFLTSLQKESLNIGLKQLWENKYTLIDRNLLEVKLPNSNDVIDSFPYALNEITVSRKNTASLISIDTRLNSEPLTTYWADGLIISTPTGSTGYSLSSGGPVMSPQTSSFVLTPIAPHNLNIRPLIVPNSTVIELKVTGRGQDHLLTLDSRIISLNQETKIIVKKAPFSIATVELNDNTFFKTLQDKLFWGLDTRN